MPAAGPMLQWARECPFFYPVYQVVHTGIFSIKREPLAERVTIV